MVITGLEGLAHSGFKAIQGKRIALLCNQASVTSDLTHAIDLLLPGHKEGRYCIDRVFGPQHGLWGHTQDNMIEWEGARDPRTGLVVSSLYGERRAPTDEQLREVELFVVDLQDVGARYYTFIWTMALCMEACARLGVPMLVLDRPNPIGGVAVEGPVMEPSLASFVGLHPLPARHGMTIGEIAVHFQRSFYPSLALEIGQMEGWERSMFFEETGLPWVPPSPNMPTPETAMVYPGMCLLEGTNLSEGRGTTRPFEQFGAPWLDGWALASALNGYGFPGVHFRAVEFEPTSGKFARQRCGGCFIHVLDRSAFRPVLTGLAVLREYGRAPEFAWKEPPYEYEFEKRPIDLLLGVDGLAERVLLDEPLDRLVADHQKQATRFAQVRSDCLIY